MKAAPANTARSTPQPAASTHAPPVSQTTSEAPSTALTSIQRGLVGGSALPRGLRARMEAGFGDSFGDVRVHTGGAAAAATSTLQAEAFASGSNIAFAPGAYNPGTKAGDNLIAHELAHVVQQRRSGGGGAVQAKSLLSGPGDAAETAADQAAATVVSGGRARIGAPGQSLRGCILRRARLGSASPALSTAMTQAPLRPGAVAPGAGPVLTPVMTSQVSAAGGQVSGLPSPAKGMAGSPLVKAPDEAQTARGETTADAKGPPDAAVAGSPAGAAEGESAASAGKRSKGKGKEKAGEARAGGEPGKQGEREKDGKKKKKGKKGEQAERVAGGGAHSRGGVGRTRRFGQNLGDRGAAAAEEARARLSARANALRRNEGAETRIADARAAAEPPANSAEVDGQRKQAGKLAAANVPPPDAAAAQAQAQSALASVAPSTIEELDDFAGPDGAAARDGISRSIAAEAANQTAPVRASMSAVSTPPLGVPADPAILPQPAPLAAPATPSPGLAAAAPTPAPEESLDASEFREEADGALAEHDVDDATLEKADEGPLRAIGDNKKELDENVEGAAGEARATETAATGAAVAGLTDTESTSVGAMAARRAVSQEAVSAEQEGARTGEELGQRTLAEQIAATYATAEAAVNQKLASLQNDAVKSFRDRQAQRLQAFASGVRAELDAFKQRRYRGLRGKARKVRDWFLSINSLSEVKDLYERNRNQYIADIGALLNEIKDGIQRTIDDCKQTLADARTEIDRLAEANKGKLDDDAQAALARSRQQFTQMEARIESTRAATLAALDRERQRAIEEMDAKLAEIQAENAGLVDRIANAIKALAALLGTFMRLLARVTRMGIGAFLSAAGAQAKEGVKNHLWDALKEAFKEWIFSKVPGLQLLMNLPPNWLEMLTALATNMLGLFMEHLPAMLPVIGAAAMAWLATQLALKLIPGAGAIMAVIDAIRAAWGLVQSLLSAASAFFDFVMKVAEPANGAVAFARALAHGIIAAVDMILTFLGVDALIKRVLSAIARPFGKVVQSVQARFRAFVERRRQRTDGRRRGDGRRGRDDGDDHGPNANERRSAQSRADRDQHEADRRDHARERGRDRSRDRRESDAERQRRRRQEEERRRRERLNETIAAVAPAVDDLLTNGVSRLRLRAQLAFWRIRHRIRKLALQGNAVVAGNSDDRTVRRVLSGNADNVYQMVQDIGRERMKRAAERRTKRVGTAGGGPHNIGPGDDPLELAAGLRARGAENTPRSKKNPERAGGVFTVQVGSGPPVFLAQGAGPVESPAVQRNVFVRGLGRKGSYAEIAEKLTAMGLNGPGVAEAVAKTLQTGEGPIYIKRLIVLIFGREALQSEGSAATGMLAVAAMQRGEHQAKIFGAEGQPVVGALFGADHLDPATGDGRLGAGLAPFSLPGAAQGQRDAEAGHGAGLSAQDGAFGDPARVQVLRNIELVYLAVREMEFKDTAGLRREILKLFDMMDRAHGVNP